MIFVRFRRLFNICEFVSVYRCYFWSGCYWVWTMDWRSLFLVIHLLWRDKNSWFKTYHHYSCHYYKRVYHLVGTYNFKRIWTPRLRKLACILFFSPIAYQRCGGEKANWITGVVTIMLVILPDLQLNPLLLFFNHLLKNNTHEKMLEFSQRDYKTMQPILISSNGAFSEFQKLFLGYIWNYTVHIFNKYFTPLCLQDPHIFM